MNARSLKLACVTLLLTACGSAGIVGSAPSQEARSEGSQSTTIATMSTSDMTSGRSPTPATSDGLLGISQPPTPLPTGIIEAGTATNPIVWASQPSDGVETDTAIAGGVEVDLSQPYRQRYLTFPSVREWQNLRVDGDVRLTGGNSSNEVGLGCLSSDGSLEYSFLVSAPAHWAIVEFTGPDAIGSSPTIAAGDDATVGRPNGGDHLSIACAQSGGGTRLLFAVNDTPVASVLVRRQAPFWGPAVSLCSCSGPDTARFVNLDTRAY